MKKLLLLLLLALMIPLSAGAEEAAPAAPVLEVHQLCIGCADGYLIRLGDIEIMIDGGNANPKVPTDDVVNYLRAAGVGELDAYIVTHWHLDHCMNLNAVLAEFGAADTVVYSPSPALHEDYDPLANGVYRQMKDGDVVTIGGMEFICVGPAQLKQDGRCNMDSLNFVLRYGERRILFTADYAASGNILSKYQEICADVDILKFPHHAIEPFEIGRQTARNANPEYVLVPSANGRGKVRSFLGNCGVALPFENFLNNADGHVLVLTDGAEYLEIIRHVDPADYAPAAE